MAVNKNNLKKSLPMIAWICSNLIALRSTQNTSIPTTLKFRIKYLTRMIRDPIRIIIQSFFCILIDQIYETIWLAEHDLYNSNMKKPVWLVFRRFELWPPLSNDNIMHSISLVEINFFCLNTTRWLVIFFVVRSISLWMERYK